MLAVETIRRQVTSLGSSLLLLKKGAHHKVIFFFIFVAIVAGPFRSLSLKLTFHLLLNVVHEEPEFTQRAPVRNLDASGRNHSPPGGTSYL